MIRGIDSDNYDAFVSESRFAALLSYGISFNIIGLEAGMPYANPQRSACEAAGIAVPRAYKFLYWVDSDIEAMKQACRFEVPIFIDCEWRSGMAAGSASTVGRIAEAKSVLRAEGLYGGIYTGQWWWVPNTGNSQLFKDDPLWHAAYPFGNKLPPQDFYPDFDSFQPYGGWTRPQVWQYANTCYGEKGFDMNAAERPFWEPPAPQPAPEPDKVALYEALISAGQFVRLGWNLSDLSNQDKDALRSIVNKL